MSHEYCVLVQFSSEEEIENPAAYVASAVAEMQGCMSPDDPLRSISSESVTAIDACGVPGKTTMFELAEIMNPDQEVQPS